MNKRSEDAWYAVGDEVRTYRGTLLTVNEWLTDEEAEEVARIAAAAPQMLQALEAVAEVATKQIVALASGGSLDPFDLGEAIQRCNHAIKKAKGEEDE